MHFVIIGGDGVQLLGGGYIPPSPRFGTAAYLHMKNTLPAVKKVSDCPLTLSEPVSKKGLSVEALESRRTNIGVTRINFLFTTYCM